MTAIEVPLSDLLFGDWLDENQGVDPFNVLDKKLAWENSCRGHWHRKNSCGRPSGFAAGNGRCPRRQVESQVETVETADAWIVQAEVPGVSKDALTITVDSNILTLRGVRKAEGPAATERLVHCERPHRNFEHQFELPAGVDVDAIQARLEDGILTVTLPKLASGAIKGRKQVPITGGADGAPSGSGAVGGEGRDTPVPDAPAADAEGWEHVPDTQQANPDKGKEPMDADTVAALEASCQQEGLVSDDDDDEE